MTSEEEIKLRASRRGFLTGAASLAAAAGAGFSAVTAASAVAAVPDVPAVRNERFSEPFWGTHQSGIITPPQSHTYFAVFDLVATKREQVARLLQVWTAAAARMTTGATAQPLDAGLKPVAVAGAAQPTGSDDYETPQPGDMPADTGEALGLPPARLTITFGFGAGLFTKDGKDRYGLAARRPAALVDLPRFVGDQLVDQHTGGDISVQACADDGQIAFHAVRQLARLGDGVAQIRWVQTGFLPSLGGKETPRNLMGFKDGTNNLSVSDPRAMDQFVWVGNEGPDWMRGGSYLVARRIRIALEHWDRMKVTFQEQTVGRHKYSGAPLGKKNEFDAFDFKATDKDGNPVTPENAHVRLAAAETNDGARILRRGYSYNDGVNFTAERWPPWRQGIEYDAGLFFVCYQRDPRTGFIKIFERMAKIDMMNQFVTHVGGGLFACPHGASEGEFIGQELFETT
ncbi:MAG TPA: Dyp-type peroxidase [Acetobacteraceae bacterium]|nr:Dyp-type peroxidase [Acetobacteraceae bacterium]